MNIIFNGQTLALATAQINLTELLQHQGAKEPFAVAVNQTFVPRSRCDDYQIQAGDSIELLSPIQGG
ncbi:sulfur carrier protein ThiS [Pseudoalteromonas tunicata]|jgi:sulfur carrier protein|uniref:Putative ThiS protein n=1 Tax=Pseudoalteromonas tunicata D2 TaxID=87626 RepID=A4C8K9_9GAMM|nr:sulfur carrier protein ThiS [Pseudoalteromonas tunicata]ATC93428.1 sulfur carrier protein [Pseudoalteromonas tunicata]AXT32470.1 sulfur carrier protein ThiS [Pseudoalteromonas tunicata]EAR28924.1 putative ThiS protein [Pseudoalteromonas tunicata D2]MDP4983578.1 sulfur carrier protein ThiS [Pseudoalteromonas tunicata]